MVPGWLEGTAAAVPGGWFGLLVGAALLVAAGLFLRAWSRERARRKRQDRFRSLWNHGRGEAGGAGARAPIPSDEEWEEELERSLPRKAKEPEGPAGPWGEPPPSGGDNGPRPAAPSPPPTAGSPSSPPPPRPASGPSRSSPGPSPQPAAWWGGSGASEDEERVELLPGRLQTVQGHDDPEVRFLRRPGLSRFTLGRSGGSPHEHVQIREPTVSRMHAYMDFTQEGWLIGNLSETNPVQVNGAPVEGEDARLLRDGDRVRIGGVVFVFRER